jgi:stage III sporulation protein SpoIIIAA
MRDVLSAVAKSEVKNYPITDNLEELLAVLPKDIKERLEQEEDLEDLLEIVMDLGRPPEARFPNRALIILQRQITQEDLDHIVCRVGEFGKDNRAGIARTLHRISAIRNRQGKIIGLTCRIGRAVYGTLDIIRDVVDRGQSVLILGRPGVGKTTMCREAARVISEELNKRVVVVDTSNEIAGDGDIPHAGIGRARRMQVPYPELQHDVMIEAVENHMPQVIVIDEIGREEEALAARTIAERGVQLIATAHGNTLERLLMNPTLVDLVGGIHTVTLSDEEAKRRDTQKTILERKAPPTFEVLVEIMDMGKLAIHHDVAQAVDKILRGIAPRPEIRLRKRDGEVEVLRPAEGETRPPERFLPKKERPSPCKIFPYGVSKKRLERAIWELKVPVTLTKNYHEAEAFITLKSHYRRHSEKLKEILPQGIPIYQVKSNTYTQISNILQDIFHLRGKDEEEEALREAKEAIQRVLMGEPMVELSPQRSHVRRLQHQLIEGQGLSSESVGVEPFRRIKIYR